MRTFTVIGWVLSCVMLGGCSTMQGIKGATWPWPNNVMPCKAQCHDEDAMRAFVHASSYCRDVQNYYESGGFYATSSRLAVGTLGALAGTVFAPLSGGDTAKAWAGLSGATNALQSQMDEAFSSAVSVRRRAAIASIAKEGSDRFLRAKTPTEKVFVAIDTARACSMGSAVADQGTLRALTEYQDENEDDRAEDSEASDDPTEAEETAGTPGV